MRLTRLFVESLEGYEPRILDLDKPILIMGMAVQTNLRRIYQDVPALGKRYKKFKDKQAIPNKKEPWAFAAVTWDHDPESGSMTYMMGDVVTSLKDVPQGLRPFEIPAIKYAIFPIRPKNRFGWPFAIAEAKRYAYTVWLPKSGYQTAGAIDDFEFHDERSARKKDPEADLYVAIK